MRRAVIFPPQPANLREMRDELAAALQRMARGEAPFENPIPKTQTKTNMKKNNTAREAENKKSGAAEMPSGSKNENGEAVAAASPKSLGPAGNRESKTREESTPPAEVVTPEKALTTTEVVADPSIRENILAARKTPQEVAQLISAQTEQLTCPVYKRPPDSAFWRVRTGGDWDPSKTEVLLLPRKESGGGPEFLLVLPELEALVKSDPRLRNLVRYHHLAFVVDARGRVGWWAVPSRSENDWHVSARIAMRHLADHWGMVKSDQTAQTYKLERPTDDLGEPQWPVGSYDDWFVKGLADKVIDSTEHPVLRELQGRV